MSRPSGSGHLHLVNGHAEVNRQYEQQSPDWEELTSAGLARWPGLGGLAGDRDLDRAAGAEALHGGVGEDEGFAAVGEGGGGGRAGLHRGDEVVEFGPVGGLVALAEEVQVRGRRLAAIGTGVADA